MRILVTGAAGFIGSHVARALLRSGHEVIALVRPTTPLERLADIADRLTVVRASLEDEGLVEALRRVQPEGCIHLAWYAQPGKYLEAPENVACLSASLRLLETLAASKCRHVVMAGTCAEYDTELGYLREDGPTAPRTIYAASKLALSLVAAARATQLGIGFAWARLLYLYGPEGDPRTRGPAQLRRHSLPRLGSRVHLWRQPPAAGADQLVAASTPAPGPGGHRRLVEGARRRGAGSVRDLQHLPAVPGHSPERVPCRFCGRPATLRFQTMDWNRRLSSQAFRYYRCSGCAGTFLSPVPGDRGRS